MNCKIEGCKREAERGYNKCHPHLAVAMGWMANDYDEGDQD